MRNRLDATTNMAFNSTGMFSAWLSAISKQAALILCCSTLLTACGQSGSLYLSEHPSSPTNKQISHQQGES